MQSVDSEDFISRCFKVVLPCAEVAASSRPAEQAMPSAETTSPLPVEQKLKTHGEPTKLSEAASREQQEKPDMAAVMGFWRRQEALLVKQPSERQRMAHPARWTNQNSLPLGDARQDGGKEKLDQARLLEPAANSWGLDANSEPENSEYESTKEASANRLLEKSSDHREQPQAAPIAAASARASGNRQVHDDSSATGGFPSWWRTIGLAIAELEERDWRYVWWVRRCI